LLEQFDAASENLTNIINSHKLNKENFVNDFFTNLLIWGSYKEKNKITTERIKALANVSKKFSYLIKKLQKILNKQSKYYLSPTNHQKILKILDYLHVIEGHFRRIIMKKRSKLYK